MPQGVVDQFKTVKIKKQQGKLLVISVGMGKNLGDPIIEQHPVRQPGQQIMIGLVADARFGAFSHRDIACATERPDKGPLPHGIIFIPADGVQLDNQFGVLKTFYLLAGFVDQETNFDILRGPGIGTMLAEKGIDIVCVVRMDQLGEMLTDQLTPLITEQIFNLIIHVGKDPVRVEQIDKIR